MEKRIYVNRHCEAEGQSSNAQLTEKGVGQAAELVGFFEDMFINRIISSPYSPHLSVGGSG